MKDLTREEIQEAIDLLQSWIEEEPEVQPEFRFLQPVLVRDEDYQEWKKAIYLKKLNNNEEYIHRATYDGSTIAWKQCIPDPEAITRINWIKWEGGECPTDKPVILKHRHESLYATKHPKNWIWGHSDDPKDHEIAQGDIIAYSILED